LQNPEEKMLNRVSKLLVVLCAIASAASFASPLRAQSDEKEKPPMYTYVAEWGIQRADWPAYEKANAATKQVMDKLMADGTIVEYGSYRNLVHHEGEPTHGEWWTASSYANLFKALSALTSAANNPDLGKIFAASKHSDLVLVSRQYNGHSGTFENVYLRGGGYKEKEGHGETLDRAIKSYIVPNLEKLLADGAIHAYSVDREAIHTDDPSNVWIVVACNGPEGLDKFYAALEAAGRANPTGGPAFGSATDGSAHRDFLDLATIVRK
jgi:hypothetical protein